jgi:phosphoenolpyruvate carboxylase
VNEEEEEAEEEEEELRDVSSMVPSVRLRMMHQGLRTLYRSTWCSFGFLRLSDCIACCI